MVQKVRAGDRVRMTGVMQSDPDPLEVGEEGTVTEDGPSFAHQIFVRWDSGRTLILLDSDPFVVVSESASR